MSINAHLCMNTVLQHSPGQRVTLVLQLLDGYGSRADSTDLPVITRIIFPDLTLAVNYPQYMIRIDTGLYIYSFDLPSKSTSVGTYIVDVSYEDQSDFTIKETYYQVVVTAPYGNYSVSSSP